MMEEEKNIYNQLKEDMDYIVEQVNKDNDIKIVSYSNLDDIVNTDGTIWAEDKDEVDNGNERSICTEKSDAEERKTRLMVSVDFGDIYVYISPICEINDKLKIEFIDYSVGLGITNPKKENFKFSKDILTRILETTSDEKYNENKSIKSFLEKQLKKEKFDEDEGFIVVECEENEIEKAIYDYKLVLRGGEKALSWEENCFEGTTLPDGLPEKTFFYRDKAPKKDQNTLYVFSNDCGKIRERKAYQIKRDKNEYSLDILSFFNNATERDNYLKNSASSATTDKKPIDLYNNLQKESWNAFSQDFATFYNATYKTIGNDENTMEIRKLENILDKHLNVILTGAPGSGKTHFVRQYVEDKIEKKEQMKFVQFHAGYDYVDFVGGYKPKIENGQMTFEVKNGVFRDFCKKASQAKNDIDESNKTLSDEEKKPIPQYYFIIDEINRADLSRVFGELFFGLEEGYRGKEFDTQYEDSDGNAKMVIPENVHVIGTMNDVDRGVETIDFALRRRFYWYEVEADLFADDILDEKGNKDVIKGRMQALNELIDAEEYGLGSAYHIGAAYFKDIDHGDFDELFENRLRPLLQEYMRGRRPKLVEEFLNKAKDKVIHGKTSKSETNTEQTKESDGGEKQG